MRLGELRADDNGKFSSSTFSISICLASDDGRVGSRILELHFDADNDELIDELDDLLDELEELLDELEELLEELVELLDLKFGSLTESSSSSENELLTTELFAALESKNVW